MKTSRTRYFSVAALALVALVATACMPDTNPTRGDVINSSWGAGMSPKWRNVPYKTGASVGCGATAWKHDDCNGSQTLDIYPATLGGNKGTIVIIHGGGFINNDKWPLEPLGLVNRQNHLGWNLVSVNYRLARNGQNLFPAAMQDVSAALQWVRARGSSYGMNTERLVVVGYSAGGTLSALAGVAANSGRSEFAGLPPISGWVSVAGIHDFNDPGMAKLWGTYWMGPNFPAQKTIASPLNWLDRTDPKGYLAHGDLDTFVEPLNSQRMKDRAEFFGFGGRVEYDLVDYYAGGAPIVGSREHGPAGGMHAGQFQAWIDSLPSLHTTSNPYGSLDSVRRTDDNRVKVGGWAIDPDRVGPVDIHVYVGAAFGGVGNASAPRPDVGNAYPVYGANHGYTVTVNAPRGARVCAYAINIGNGTTNPSLGCRTAP